MAKKVTELRIQRSDLRRVVQDKLQALLRGDFYVRNHLGEENYDPIVAEVKKLNEGILLALMQHEKEQRSQQMGGGGGTTAAAAASTTAAPTAQLQFSKELESFIQILAASIMIDASMRGENAGESDTRFIKKKKKLLTRMLMGGKLYILRREIVRFDLMNKKGLKDGSVELIEAIGIDPPETEVEEDEESSSDESESEEEEKKRPKKRKYNFSSKNDNDDVKSVGTMDDSSDEDDDDDDDDSLSDTATSENTSLSKSGAEDGFSASATSSKEMKKAKKKARKEEKRRAKKERKRIRRDKKEKKRKEKEEKKRKRKLEKDLKKRKKMKHHHHHSSHEKQQDNADFMEEEFGNDMDDADEVELDSTQMDGQEDDIIMENVSSFEFKTKEEFDAYRHDIISQIPKSVRKRFRHGGFSKWGKDWLPVIELGPFDVEPGPVRDMWMDMFHNTQESGRDMTHLIFWYGVKFEDRGQGFSFVPDGKIMPYDEGESKGCHIIPKKIQTKIDKNQKLTKTEEQIKNGLRQIVTDMALEKFDRIKWMMNFKEDYELAVEAAERAAKVSAAAKPKRKPGRPKKEEGADKPRRGPGRPKKLVDGEDQPVKRKPGRPKKSEQEKAVSKAEKCLVVDEDQPESNIDTDDDDDDEDFGDDDSDSDDDLKADTDSDTGGKKKGRKSDASQSERKKPGRKPSKPNMTEEEKAQERREKAAAYREKKAREKAEALGLEYVPGRKGRKSKATIMDEEQMKFTKCEEVFCPLMERLEKARSESNAEAATDCLNLLMKRVELVTPSFLRTHGLGMVVKQTRKAFESTHPTVKDKCKKLTNEMKRLYTEKDKNIPDEFEPVKNMKNKPQLAKKKEEKKKKRKDTVPSVIKSEQPQAEKSVADATPKVKPEPQQQQQAEKAQAAKLASLSSAGSPDVVKTEPQKKQLFSIKGMFEKPKPKPVPRPKNISAPNVVVSDPQMSPRAPKSLPSWVTGPAVKSDFHEQHVKERSFGLEFLIDAASKVSSEKFDPVSVSQSFELAIFAETKLRGRNWKQYWEKVHDIVAMLSPGKNKPNAILQGIKSGNYQEPSELVKLSRREIETVNNLS